MFCWILKFSFELFAFADFFSSSYPESLHISFGCNSVGVQLVVVRERPDSTQLMIVLLLLILNTVVAYSGHVRSTDLLTNWLNQKKNRYSYLQVVLMYICENIIYKVVLCVCVSLE